MLLDCDGVLADFTDHLLTLIGSNLTLADITDWHFLKLLRPNERRAAYMLLEGEEFWATQPVVAGAREGVDAMRADGHHVVCVTAPWLTCKNWGYIRREWLKTHFDIEPDDIANWSSKHRVSGDVFIDDKPEHVARWAEANPGLWPILFDQPYNRTATRTSKQIPFDRGHWHPTRPDVRSISSWVETG